MIWAIKQSNYIVYIHASVNRMRLYTSMTFQTKNQVISGITIMPLSRFSGVFILFYFSAIHVVDLVL